MDSLQARGNVRADDITDIMELIATCLHSGERPLTPRQERNRRYYGRLKASETVLIKTDVLSPCPPYDKNNSTPLSPISTPLPLKKEERAKRLPEDWLPSESLLSSETVQKLGLPREVLSFETEAFRDHFLGNGGRKINWDRAWMNWMREALRRRSRFEPKRSNVVTGSFRPKDAYEPPKPERTPEQQAAIDAQVRKAIKRP
jgi:hypothetical protein